MTTTPLMRSHPRRSPGCSPAGTSWTTPRATCTGSPPTWSATTGARGAESDARSSKEISFHAMPVVLPRGPWRPSWRWKAATARVLLPTSGRQSEGARGGYPSDSRALVPPQPRFWSTLRNDEYRNDQQGERVIADCEKRLSGPRLAFIVVDHHHAAGVRSVGRNGCATHRPGSLGASCSGRRAPTGTFAIGADPGDGGRGGAPGLHGSVDHGHPGSAPHHRGAGARGDQDARRGHRRREHLVPGSASRRGQLPPA